MHLDFCSISYPCCISDHLGSWLAQCIASSAGILRMESRQLGTQQPCTALQGSDERQTSRLWELQAVVAQKGLWDL